MGFNDKTHITDLDVVEQHFQLWRANKKGQQRIPRELWDMVVPLIGEFGIGKVASTLGMSYQQIRSKLELHQAETKEQTPSEFVLLPITPSKHENISTIEKHDVTFTMKNKVTLTCQMSSAVLYKFLQGDF